MEIGIICGVCGLVLIIGLMKRKAEYILNFLVRAVVGLIGIYFLDQLMVQKGIDMVLGINPVNALTIGALGVGGFALLYGIMWYHSL